MRCYNCGQTIEDTARFCRFCGAGQIAAPAPVNEEAAQTIVMPMDPPTEIVPETQSNPEPVFEAPAWAFQPEAEPVYQPEPAPVYQPEPAPVYQPEPEPVYQPEPVPAYAPAYAPAYQPQYSSAPVYTESHGERPRIQLPTHRGLAKMFFLSIVTLGIYPTVIWSRIVTELNITASRYDGKRTMPFFAMSMLMPLTLGIYYLVWITGFCGRIGDELKRREIPYKFGASTFWLWNILGSLIVVGPFIYLHKLLKSMNLINAAFNEHG